MIQSSRKDKNLEAGYLPHPCLSCAACFHLARGIPCWLSSVGVLNSSTMRHKSIYPSLPLKQGCKLWPQGQIWCAECFVNKIVLEQCSALVLLPPLVSGWFPATREQGVIEIKSEEPARLKCFLSISFHSKSVQVDSFLISLFPETSSNSFPFSLQLINCFSFL